MDWRARSDLSASAALSLVALSDAKRCCAGVCGLVVTSITRMQLFMPNKSWFICRIRLGHINKQQVAAEENCHCKVTTDSEQRPPRFGALQLDIGVAGMEYLSSSRDLMSLPVEDDAGGCAPVGTRSQNTCTKVAAHHSAPRASTAHTATCKR